MEDEQVKILMNELAKEVKRMSETVVSLEANSDSYGKNLDVFFLTVNGMIIFFMQCGFAFLETGAVRSKNATNILLKNVLDSFVSGIAYWVFGYAFAYGGDHFFIGSEYFASHQLADEELAGWFFQYVFAATAATIVSGAMAERCEFVAYLAYSFLITGFVYPVATHWVWGDGWLATGQYYPTVAGDVNGTYFKANFQDFAGSGVVHLLGGTAALMGACILGQRIEVREGNKLKGHSVPLVALGGFILFFGFFAFNSGSQLSISQEGDGGAVALSAANTIISGSLAAFTTLFVYKLFTVCKGESHWSLLMTLNGALTGMVAICSGCNAMSPHYAAATGAVAGLVYLFWSNLIRKIGVDDPLDAFAVHAGGGMWGLVATAIFKREDGIVYEFGRKSFMGLAWQFVGIAAIIGWSGFCCGVLFILLRLVGLLRVSEEYERKGLDIPKHGEPAYPVSSYGHGWEEVEPALVIPEDDDQKLRRRIFVNTDSAPPAYRSRSGPIGSKKSKYLVDNVHSENERRSVDSISVVKL